MAALDDDIIPCAALPDWATITDMPRLRDSCSRAKSTHTRTSNLLTAAIAAGHPAEVERLQRKLTATFTDLHGRHQHYMKQVVLTSPFKGDGLAWRNWFGLRPNDAGHGRLLQPPSTRVAHPVSRTIVPGLSVRSFPYVPNVHDVSSLLCHLHH